MDRVIKQLRKDQVRDVEKIKAEMNELDKAVREERGGLARHKSQKRKEELKNMLKRMGVPGV